MPVKEMWSDEDFPSMGWHDCRIYALKLLDENFNFELDIDYIFEWKEVEGKFQFYVSPCVLKFLNVSDVKISFSYGKSLLCFINSVKRINKRLSPNGLANIWDYEIECDVGSLNFTCTGYEQRVMASPQLIEGQDLNRDFLVIS